METESNISLGKTMPYLLKMSVRFDNEGGCDENEENEFDLIHNITENGLRHARGPVPSNLPSFTYTSLYKKHTKQN